MIGKSSKRRKHRSQEVGLSIGFLMGRYAFGMKRLNFGYWTEDLPVSLANLSRAQERYDELLLAHVPKGAGSVLEVGCGTGQLARSLVDRGLEVDLVSPNQLLMRVARETLGDTVRYFECGFEDLEADRRYDLVLFSESFQYVKWGVPLVKSAELLEPGGHLLICDFFHLLPLGVSAPIRGGRRLASFEGQLAELPYEILTELDITENVAPGLEIVRDADARLLAPIYEVLRTAGEQSHPWLTRLIRWLARKKIALFEQDVVCGRRTPESFAETKSYRLYLLRRRGSS